MSLFGYWEIKMPRLELTCHERLIFPKPTRPFCSRQNLWIAKLKLTHTWHLMFRKKERIKKEWNKKKKQNSDLVVLGFELVRNVQVNDDTVAVQALNQNDRKLTNTLKIVKRAKIRVRLCLGIAWFEKHLGKWWTRSLADRHVNLRRTPLYPALWLCCHIWHPLESKWKKKNENKIEKLELIESSLDITFIRIEFSQRSYE